MVVLRNFLEDNGAEFDYQDTYRYNPDTKQMDTVKNDKLIIKHWDCYAEVKRFIRQKLGEDIEDFYCIPNLIGAFAIKLKSADKYLLLTFQHTLAGNLIINRKSPEGYEESKTRIKTVAEKSGITPQTYSSDEFTVQYPLVLLKKS
jgi:hypothetical protein